MKTLSSLLIGASLAVSSTLVSAADYEIDTKGMHAFVQFRIQHLGYSWLHGRFEDFTGIFSYDADNPGASKASVVIKADSLDTNHAERDKHLRSDDFLNVDKYPEIRFESTKYQADGAMQGMLYGNLTLHGTTKPIAIQVSKIGEGKDPWGGYRAGFEGTTEINRSEFGVDKNLGPSSEKVEITLSIEGIRK